MSFSKVLNAIQSHNKDPKTYDMSQFKMTPLAEDVELQCFLPLTDVHDALDFSEW